jgi:hypothetical protein
LPILHNSLLQATANFTEEKLVDITFNKLMSILLSSEKRIVNFKTRPGNASKDIINLTKKLLILFF